jgi:hypothetical protein
MEQSTEKELIEDLLRSLPESIENKTEESIQAKEFWQKMELTCKNDSAKIRLTEKAKNPKATGVYLDDMAMTGTYNLQMKAIESESEYRRREKEKERLMHELEITMERNYNYRQTMKVFTGGK